MVEEYEKEMATSPITTQRYELPDGQSVTLGQETFQCMEAMFRPSLLKSDCGPTVDYQYGIADMVHCGLQRCDQDIRLELYRNIILTGGNTMHRGFAERLRRELAHREPKATVRVISPPERRSSVWIGGSILGSLQNYRGMWITKSAYEEHGPTVVHHNSSTVF